MKATEWSQRLLVLAPIGRDAELIAGLARSHNLQVTPTTTIAEFCAEFCKGLGAAVVTEEALAGVGLRELSRMVGSQPPWSDVPILLLINRVKAEDRAERTVGLASPLGNVTLIERPVRPGTLVSAFESVLRDRRRQYEIRDVIESERAAWESARTSEEQLRTALLAAGLGSWRIDVETGDLTCSEACRQIVGLPDRPDLKYQDVVDRMHVDHREETQRIVQDAIDRDAEFQILYRVPWEDGSDHWVLVRGQAFTEPTDKKVMAGVTMDVTERTRAQQVLEDSERRYRALSEELELRVQERTMELTLANQEMEGFTYSVSHDLRAPLRAIASTSMILKEDYGHLLPPDALGQLDRQSAASTKLAHLIDDLLRLSRISRQEVRRKEINLSEMANEIASELMGRVEARVKIEIEPDLKAEGDPTLIRLAMLNLLENAVKFSPTGGEIRVGSDGENGSRRFFVQDQGIGMDPRYSHKIFLPFERLVTDAQFPGTGIGLANVQRIIRKHGGEIWVESELGQGTTFFFTL